MKNLLLKWKFAVWLGILYEKIRESFFLVKNMATGNIQNDANKLYSRIQIECHAIEKGMSIGDVRKGFGKAKFEGLLSMMIQYIKLNGNDWEYLSECCSVLSKYIEFNTDLGADMKYQRICLDKFCNDYSIQLVDKGGIETIERSNETHKHLDFFTVAHNRSSVRDFGEKKIVVEDVMSALKLSETSPSACNRQSWKIFVYFDEKERDLLFKMQGGSRGFYEKMQCAILVCGNMNSYSFQEQGVLFVDGGLYSMNLLYSLYYYGLAAIPLTMGKNIKGIREIQNAFNIPQNIVPVLLIGVGTFKDKYKVAKSERFPYEKYCTIIS